MKHKFLPILAICIFIISCKSKQETISIDLKGPVEISMPKNIKLNSNLNATIVVNEEAGIFLFDPMLTRIEKFENNTWNKLRILHCPCGANCEPPPRFKKLSKGEIWEVKWNLKESWCKKNTKNAIPETIEKKAAIGKYRVVIYYGYNQTERIKYTKEFQIIN